MLASFFYTFFSVPPIASTDKMVWNWLTSQMCVSNTRLNKEHMSVQQTYYINLQHMDWN